MKKNRILIVDDRENERYLLRTLLQGHGYHVVNATNGASALSMARQNPPDLIISDILMPVMDGFSLCREWKKDEHLNKIPFIFYTATYTDDKDREFALSLGAERFVTKPEEPDALVAIVREAIEQVGRPPADSPSAAPFESHEGNETAYLKQYNESLVRKLESKTEKLERANSELEKELVTRHLAQAAMRESEARFRTMVEASPEGIFVQSEGVFVFLNPSMCRLLGVSKPEDLTGAKLMERIAPEYHQAVRERIRLQAETGKPAPPMAQEYLRLDGSRIPVETTAVVIEYRGRNAHLVFVRDITERKKAEETLRVSEKKFRELAENINDVLFTMDSSGRITYISPRITSYSGYTPEEMTGRFFEDFIFPEDIAALESSFRDTLEGRLEPWEFRYHAKDGAVKWARTSSRPINENGQIIGIRGLLSDITAQKNMEEELIKARNLDSLCELARKIAHDFNNILTIVGGNTSLLRLNLDPADSSVEIIAEAEKGLAEARGLTEQLSAFAKGIDKKE